MIEGIGRAWFQSADLAHHIGEILGVDAKSAARGRALARDDGRAAPAFAGSRRSRSFKLQRQTFRKLRAKPPQDQTAWLWWERPRPARTGNSTLAGAVVAGDISGIVQYVIDLQPDHPLHRVLDVEMEL